jgi:hypothetical protein
MDSSSSIKIDVIVKVDEGKLLPPRTNLANRQQARDRHRFSKVATGTADILTMPGVVRTRRQVVESQESVARSAGTGLSILNF